MHNRLRLRQYVYRLDRLADRLTLRARRKPWTDGALLAVMSTGLVLGATIGWELSEPQEAFRSWSGSTGAIVVALWAALTGWKDHLSGVGADRLQALAELAKLIVAMGTLGVAGSVGLRTFMGDEVDAVGPGAVFVVCAACALTGAIGLMVRWARRA